MAKNKQPQIPAEVLKYLQGLMIEKGLDNMPGSIQGDMLIDLFDRYNNYLLANFIAAMDEKTRADFNDFLDQEPGSKEVEDFLRNNLDYEKIVMDTSEEFRNVFLNVDESPKP